jgi:hypothetical protein
MSATLTCEMLGMMVSGASPRMSASDSVVVTPMQRMPAAGRQAGRRPGVGETCKLPGPGLLPSEQQHLQPSCNGSGALRTAARPTCCPRRLHARRRVLNDDAVGGLAAQVAGGGQEDVGSGLEPLEQVC